MTPTTAPLNTSRPPRQTPPGGSWLPPTAAILVSAGAIALGVTAGRSPAESALTPQDGPIAAALVPPGVLALVVSLAGIAGVVALVCVLAGRARSARRPRGVLTAVLAVEVTVLGFGLGSVSSIALAGYLMALAMPALLTVLVIQAVRRYQRVRWLVLAVVAAFGAWALQTSVLRPEVLGRLATDLVTGFATAGPRLLVAALSTAATATFGYLLVTELRGTAPWSRAGAYVVRHRTLWTVVAAGCALPYGLVRMTWFTPWPVLGQSEELTSDIRLWGLLLGGAALLGCVLTVGLVRPWGERFPRWVPRLAGRPVPVAAAAAPGGVVAAVICTSALPMLVGLTFSDSGTGLGVDTMIEKLGMAVVFPFWLWGPMLALAVWGYVGRRQDASLLTG